MSFLFTSSFISGNDLKNDNSFWQGKLFQTYCELGYQFVLVEHSLKILLGGINRLIFEIQNLGVKVPTIVPGLYEDNSSSVLFMVSNDTLTISPQVYHIQNIQ